MRQWRVGTISMGASLIILGVTLFLSQFQGWDVATLFLSWWPFILIVLGAEILTYFILSKKEHTLIKYDFLSILFIGILGTVALGFMFLTVSGLLEEIRYTVKAEEQTYDLPSYMDNVPGHIERIVLDTDDQPIRIEGTKGNALQVFGTYRTSRGEEMKSVIQEESDYISINESDETIYMKIKRLPEKQGIFNEHTDSEIIVLMPVNVSLELRGEDGYQTVTMRPGDLKADWSIQNAGYVSVQLMKDSDVQVKAVGIQEQGAEDYAEKVWKTGDGAHHLNVTTHEPDQVHVSVQGN